MLSQRAQRGIIQVHRRLGAQLMLVELLAEHLLVEIGQDGVIVGVHRGVLLRRRGGGEIFEFVVVDVGHGCGG